MSSLYDEAIADAKELVRMAEENATNKLIEAVAPRIRKLVEKKLVKEADDDEDIDSIVNSLENPDDLDMEEPVQGDMDDLEDDEMGEDEFEEEEEDDFDDAGDDAGDFGLGSLSRGGTITLPSDGVKKINIEFEGDSLGGKMLTDEGVVLTNESINALLGIIDGKGGLRDRIRETRMELRLIGRALGALNEGRSTGKAALRIVESFNNILRKSLGFQGELNTLPRGELQEASTREMNLLLKEIKQMSTRSLLRTLLEREERAKRTGRLREAADEEAADDEGADEGTDDAGDDAGDDAAEDEGGGDVDVDAVKSAIESLAAAVGMEVSPAGDEDADAGDEGGDDEIKLEMDMDEMDEMDEMEMPEGSLYDEMDEMDDMDSEGMHMESRRRSGTVFTINETMLRRELQRLRARRLREEIEPGHAFGGTPEKKFKAYDDVELNANVSESDNVKKAKKEAKHAKEEAEEAKQEAVKEARKNRALVGRLKEAAAAVEGLRRELNEQKLFNAKLLFVNKLMQNAALPQSKLKAVVEALDSAKTIREANLLYKSLNESLTRASGNLTEGTNRTVGSSSRSTRPGGMINESVGETDRWAVLAGIGNGKA